jgi:hypothetical protein
LTVRVESSNTSGLSSPAPPAARSPRAKNQLGQVTSFLVSASASVRALALDAVTSAAGAGICCQAAIISRLGYPVPARLTTSQTCSAKRPVMPSFAASPRSVAEGSPSAARCL